MFYKSEVIDAMKKWENSLVREKPKMLVLFLGVTFTLASTALAECPDVGISAQASDRWIYCIGQGFSFISRLSS